MSIVVTLPVFQMLIPPPCDAELPVTVQWDMVGWVLESRQSIPPPKTAVFPVIVQLVILGFVSPKPLDEHSMPPPLSAEFEARRQFDIVGLESWQQTPPPKLPEVMGLAA